MMILTTNVIVRVPVDSDLDLVCDQDDICPSFDDTEDTDGIPNGCDDCNGSLSVVIMKRLLLKVGIIEFGFLV